MSELAENSNNLVKETSRSISLTPRVQPARLKP
jgi:hypothetical protein